MFGAPLSSAGPCVSHWSENQSRQNRIVTIRRTAKRARFSRMFRIVRRLPDTPQTHDFSKRGYQTGNEEAVVGVTEVRDHHSAASWLFHRHSRLSSSRAAMSCSAL